MRRESELEEYDRKYCILNGENAYRHESKHRGKHWFTHGSAYIEKSTYKQTVV